MAKKAKASTAVQSSKTQSGKNSVSAAKNPKKAPAKKPNAAVSKKLEVTKSKKTDAAPMKKTDAVTSKKMDIKAGKKSSSMGAQKSSQKVTVAETPALQKKKSEAQKPEMKKSEAKKSEVNKPTALSAAADLNGDSPIKSASSAKQPKVKAKRPQTIKERFPSTGGSSLDLFKARPKSRPSTMSSSEDEFVDEDEQEVQQVQKMVTEEPGALNKKWKQLHDKHKAKKAVPYKLTEAYEAKTPLVHKTMGWGYIINIVNDRLEVLFEEGVKHLISNYKK